MNSSRYYSDSHLGHSKDFHYNSMPKKSSSKPIYMIIAAVLSAIILIGWRFSRDNSYNEQLFEPIHHHHEHPQLRPLVISGPSGVGKGTLIQMLVDYYNVKIDWIDPEDHQHHHPLSFSVSHTTRGPRPGEVDGVHYHFTSKEKIMKEIEANEFIEHAEVHGNIYGTSYKAVEKEIKKGKICILDIDIQGAKRVKEDTSILTPHFIFIAPPSMEILERRLRDRKTETEEAIQRRLGNAQREIDFGYAHGNFDDVVVNDDLQKCFHHLRMILEEWYPHLNQVMSPEL